MEWKINHLDCENSVESTFKISYLLKISNWRFR